jgi:pimeloyl-ACP methyl ester carboxylesterase
MPARMPKSVLLFIPGNPGIIEYYDAFFRALQQHHPKLEIHAFNHIGFSSGGKSARRLPKHEIELDAQIAHAIDRLDSLLTAYKNQASREQPHIFVAGHSVGAYIACKMLEARPHAIRRLYLLTPTLTEIAKSPQGQIMALCLRVPAFIRVVAAFVWLITSLVPQIFRKKIVARYTGFSDEAVRVTTDSVVQPINVYTALTLAASEMREIRGPDRAFWKEFAHHCSAYWVEKDHWTHLASRDQLLAETHMESYFCKRANHAFCVRHSELVADVVAGWLGRDMALDFAKTVQ